MSIYHVFVCSHHHQSHVCLCCIHVWWYVKRLCYVCVCACMYMCMRVSLRMCVCVWVCMVIALGGYVWYGSWGLLGLGPLHMNNASDWAVASQQHCLGLLEVARSSFRKVSITLQAAAVTQLDSGFKTRISNIPHQINSLMADLFKTPPWESNSSFKASTSNLKWHYWRKKKIDIWSWNN